MNLQELEGKYGSVEFEGKKYILANQADETSRLLDYPKNYHEVDEGEEFDFEMSAAAYDEEGNRFNVYWIFSDVKGEGQDLDMFDYNKVNRVEPL